MAPKSAAAKAKARAKAKAATDSSAFFLILTF